MTTHLKTLFSDPTGISANPLTLLAPRIEAAKFMLEKGAIEPQELEEF